MKQPIFEHGGESERHLQPMFKQFTISELLTEIPESIRIVKSSAMVGDKFAPFIWTIHIYGVAREIEHRELEKQ